MTDRDVYQSYVNNFFLRANQPKNVQMYKQLQRSNPTSPERSSNINIKCYTEPVNIQKIVEENVTRFVDVKTVQLGNIYGCNVGLSKENQPRVYQRLVNMSSNYNVKQLTPLDLSSPVNVVKVKNYIESTQSSRSRSALKMNQSHHRQSPENKSPLRSLIFFPHLMAGESKEGQFKKQETNMKKDVNEQLNNTSYISNYHIRKGSSSLNKESQNDSHIMLNNIFNKRQKLEEGVSFSPQNTQKSFFKESTQNTFTIHKDSMFSNQMKLSSSSIKPDANTVFTKKKLLGPPTLYSRLKKNPEQYRNIENLIKNKSKESHEENMQEYLKRIGCTDTTKKVFCINSSDEFVKEVLLELGWIENSLYKSDLFHLKWIYTDSPKDYENLKEGQFFNHFQNNQELTDKGRLLRNLREYLSKNSSYSQYFPIQFDVSNSQQRVDFIREYQKFEDFKNLNQIVSTIKSILSAEEQNILIDFSLNQIQNEQPKINELNQKLMQVTQTQELSSLNLQILNNINNNYKFEQKFQLVEYYFQNINNADKIQMFNFSRIAFSDSQIECNNIRRVIHTSLAFQLDILLPQMYPYTDFSNLWIIKPTGNSKGQGLQIMNDDVQIINYANQLSARLVQKYIERIYICKNENYPQLYNKKFDLRLWVLVKSFNPLIVYTYKDGYLRICSSEYDLSDTKNTFSHFTNYSINKNKFISNKNVEDSAINLRVFKNLLKQEHGISYKTQIQPKIDQIVFHSLKSAQKKIKQNYSCFEIYGFDIIFDNDLNPYLLEVNLSPACSKRSDFISKLQKNMFTSTVNLLFNTQHNSIQNWKKIEISETKLKKKIKYVHKLQQQLSDAQNYKNNIDTFSNETTASIKIQRWFRQKIKTFDKQIFAPDNNQ